MKAFLALCRVSNLPTVWMNVICAVVLSSYGEHQIAVMTLILVVSMSCFYCGGMALNDICDLEHDRKYQAFRPIPSGKISFGMAISAMLILFLLAFIFLRLLPHLKGMAAGVILFLVILAYDIFHKKSALSVILMAAARSMVYVVASLALIGELKVDVVVISLVQAFYVLVLTLVARYESKMPLGRYSWPVIPWMIAGISLIDGIYLSLLFGIAWLPVGIGFMLLTRIAQKYVRGD